MENGPRSILGGLSGLSRIIGIWVTVTSHGKFRTVVRTTKKNDWIYLF